ncbi:hypothetical protein Q19_12 [Pectobacterium phage Q19]|uniref:Uncharacterized protein n=1 Tax=Pectobacterium phage Q19 TaxID=2500576 RepID=A0A679A2W1_9CAUD|nr:hypothetical protein Q19_12 [Pectobacterium phage Q19]
MRLHYNSSNGIFSVRRQDRSTQSASEKHAKLPLIGNVVTLSPRVHLLVTRGEFIEATKGTRPNLEAVVTRFPTIRLVFKRLKEVVKNG